MLETIVDPYGKVAFPTVVKCDGCGALLDYGWMPVERGRSEGGPWFRIVEDEHYCDECAKEIDGRCEFRTCDRCGSVMVDGFCDDCCHICEDCWDAFVKETFPHGFRATPEDEYEEDDDFYQAYDPEHGWYVVGWYWTEWY